MAIVRCKCNLPVEQALSDHSKVVLSLEGLKQNGSRQIVDSATTQRTIEVTKSRSWNNYLER